MPSRLRLVVSTPDKTAVDSGAKRYLRELLAQYKLKFLQPLQIEKVLEWHKVKVRTSAAYTSRGINIFAWRERKGSRWAGRQYKMLLGRKRKTLGERVADANGRFARLRTRLARAVRGAQPEVPAQPPPPRRVQRMRPGLQYVNLDDIVNRGRAPQEHMPPNPQWQWAVEPVPPVPLVGQGVGVARMQAAQEEELRRMLAGLNQDYEGLEHHDQERQDVRGLAGEIPPEPNR